MTNEEIAVVVDAIAAKAKADVDAAKAATKDKRAALRSKVAYLAKHYGLASALGAGALYAVQHIL